MKNELKPEHVLSDLFGSDDFNLDDPYKAAMVAVERLRDAGFAIVDAAAGTSAFSGQGASGPIR